MKPSRPAETEVIPLLESSPLFGGIARSVLREICEAFDYVSLEAGHTLFSQGDEAEALYIVLEGELEAVIEHSSGSQVVVSTMGAGTSAGEIQILFGGTRSATVRALRTSNLGRLPRKKAEELGARHPELLQRFATLVRERLRRDQLVDLLPQLFGRVDQELLVEVEAAIEWVHLRRGECLFRQGEPGNCVFFNVSGRLCAVVEEEDAPPRVVGEIPRGELVGEMALFTGDPRSASVYAIRDSELARVDDAGFDRLVARYPHLLRSITGTVVNRLKEKTGPGENKNEIVNVTVLPLSAEVPVREFTDRLVSALARAETTRHLNRDVVDRELAPGAADLSEDSPFCIRVRTWLDQLEMEHRFVVYEADPTITPWTQRCIRQADKLLLVGWADGSAELSEVERKVLAQEGEITAARRRLVLLHPHGDELPTGTLRWLRERRVEMHHHLRWDRDDDFERLGRFLRGRAIGLVLGGGGARGMAHIGVIRALVDSGIPIDFVGGTSAGGVIATQLAMGKNGAALEDDNREAFVRQKPFHDFTIPIVSLIGAKRMNRLSQQMYGSLQLEDLWINCFCVSCNISTGETIVHRQGDVWRAVRATSALPGIAVPVVDDQRLLVDGGVVDNLPGSVMKNYCSHVILVDVSPQEDLHVDYDEIPRALKILWSWLVPHRRSIKVPTIGDVIVRTAMISSVKRREESRRLAILLLRPPVEEFGLLEFSSFDRIVEQGYRYAMSQIAQWQDRDRYVDRDATEPAS